MEQIRAPYFMTRKCSSFRYGVWSELNALTLVLPSASVDIMMARLSPTFATYMVRSRNKTEMDVVPDNSTLMSLRLILSLVALCAWEQVCCMGVLYG